MMHLPRPRHGHAGFSLLEMLAVIAIISVLLAATVLALGNSRPSVRAKKDASHMVAFLRNMWDHSKTTGSPLVINPNFREGQFAYTDPRTGQEVKARLSSGVRVLAVQLNDRFYTADAPPAPSAGAEEFAEEDPYQNALYLSEGRGLTRISVLFGVVVEDEDRYEFLTLASLNLINGKGSIRLLEEEGLHEVRDRAMERSYDDI